LYDWGSGGRDSRVVGVEEKGRRNDEDDVKEEDRCICIILPIGGLRCNWRSMVGLVHDSCIIHYNKIFMAPCIVGMPILHERRTSQKQNVGFESEVEVSFFCSLRFAVLISFAGCCT